MIRDSTIRIIVSACLAGGAMLPASAGRAAEPPGAAAVEDANTNLIPVPGRPFAAVPIQDGNTLLVSLSGRGKGDGAVAVLQRQGAGGFVVARTVTVGGLPGGLALSHDGRRLAVAIGRATLLLDISRLLSGDGDPVTARFEREAGTLYAAFSPDDRVLAVAEERVDRVTLIDPDHPDATPRSLQVGRAPVGLAFSRDGHWLYATSEAAQGNGPCQAEPGTGAVAEGIVSTIDLRAPDGPAVTATAAVGCSPVRIILSAGDTVAFVSLRGDNTVAAFRTEDLRAGLARRLSAASVGPSPVGLALSADGRTLLVADSDRFHRGVAGSVSCLRVATDTSALTTTATLASGLFPREAAALPGDKGVIVTLFSGRALQLVPPTCVH